MNKPITLDFEEADLKIKQGDDLSLVYSANGFGLPNSRIKQTFDDELNIYVLDQTGWFSEMNISIDLTIPIGQQIIIQIEKGRVIGAEKLTGRQEIRAGDKVLFLSESTLSTP